MSPRLVALCDDTEVYSHALHYLSTRKVSAGCYRHLSLKTTYMHEISILDGKRLKILPILDQKRAIVGG